MDHVGQWAGETAAYDLPHLASYFFYAARQGMIMADARCRIVAANVAAQRMTGYREAELLGRTPEIFDGEHCGVRIVRHLRRIVQRSGHWEGELWCCRKDGSRYPQQTSITGLPGGGYAAVFTDATERRQREEALTQLAFFDPLTELPNRALLVDRLRLAAVRAVRRDTRVALLFVDLDGFKGINDNFGHTRGDALLQAAATRLRGVVRTEDTVARYGGDEFAVVLEGLTSVGDADCVAGKIVGAFEQPFFMGGTLYAVTVSVGIALFPDHGADAPTLIARADAAMYEAKRAGRSGHRLAD